MRSSKYPDYKCAYIHINKNKCIDIVNVISLKIFVAKRKDFQSKINPQSGTNPV